MRLPFHTHYRLGFPPFGNPYGYDGFPLSSLFSMLLHRRKPSRSSSPTPITSISRFSGLFGFVRRWRRW
ncbi:hypothetical protein L1987_31332 [Smallanthus sonchifolius]|uniref:Uncharacterized protein n=1 Tax=Smallanthus sonchifolius TaxID=185202 RepID=A0ACB9I4L8_9ASTR|nr:hypothetical protein L1987_31332 [Smallanthus sonchifolius]